MIYQTHYGPATLRCGSASVDSGFGSLEEVRSALGEPEHGGTRWLAYAEAGVAFSDFVFCLTDSSNTGHTAPNQIDE